MSTFVVITSAAAFLFSPVNLKVSAGRSHVQFASEPQAWHQAQHTLDVGEFGGNDRSDPANSYYHSPLFSPNYGQFFPCFLITHTRFSFICSSTISLCLYTHSPEILDNLFSHVYFFDILQVQCGEETIHCRYRLLYTIASSKMRFLLFFFYCRVL